MTMMKERPTSPAPVVAQLGKLLEAQIGVLTAQGFTIQEIVRSTPTLRELVTALGGKFPD